MGVSGSSLWRGCSFSRTMARCSHQFDKGMQVRSSKTAQHTTSRTQPISSILSLCVT